MTDLLQHNLITQLAWDKEVEELKAQNTSLSRRLSDTIAEIRQQRAAAAQEIRDLQRLVYNGTAPVRWDRGSSGIAPDIEIRNGRAKQYTVRYRTSEDPHYTLPADWIKQELASKIAAQVMKDVEVVVREDSARRVKTHIIDFYILFAEPNRRGNNHERTCATEPVRPDPERYYLEATQEPSLILCS